MNRLIFAPDALIRFRMGLVLIHTADSAMPPFQTDQLGLIGWLARFADPTPIDTALAVLPESARDFGHRTLTYLIKMGALIQPDKVEQDSKSIDRAHANSRRHLTRLAQEVYELSCDVSGLGPHAERMLAERSGVSVERRLQSISSAIGTLRAELAALRAPYLSEQLERLAVGPQTTGLKLHLGCGPCHLEGWINLDVYPAPLATNVMWGLPFTDGSARLVYLSHMLEHLFYPNDVQSFLAEIHRVLEPGGRVRIVVPDIAACIAAYQRRDPVFFADRRKHWGGGGGDPTPLEDFLAYSGAGPDPAYLFEAHKFGYDFETLAKALQRAGFAQIERSAHMQSRSAELRVDDRSDTASAMYGDQYYSLFAEACRP